METTNLWPVLGILAFAVVLVFLLLRFMHARRVADDRRAAAARVPDVPPRPPTPAPTQDSLDKDEQEYLDSSHISGPILPGGGRDALETWRNNNKK